MKVSASDPRARRTRDLLRAALMKLAAQKSFANLTIQEVTSQAGLNRTTFYLHYSGLPELLRDCTQTLFSQMRAEIYAQRSLGLQQGPTRLAPFVQSVFLHLERHGRFYRAMLGKQGDPLFRVLFQELLSELMFEPIADQTLSEIPEDEFELILRFFSAGFTEIAAWWLEKGRPVSADQASRLVAKVILPDYLRLIGM